MSNSGGDAPFNIVTLVIFGTLRNLAVYMQAFMTVHVSVLPIVHFSMF